MNRRMSLAARHKFQLVYQDRQHHMRMERLLGLTWRPGDQTGHFLGKLLRPVGAAVLCSLRYSAELAAGCREARRTLLTGFTANASVDGHVAYDKNVFFYDVRQRRRAGGSGRGRVLDHQRNPSLMETALALHAHCTKWLERSHRLAPCPSLPQVFLGFAPNEVPEYEETPAWREYVARDLEIPVSQLATRNATLLDTQLRNVWHERLRQPETAGNPTPYVLVDAELCNQARRSLRVYEDFSDLVGVPTWNPIREVLSNPRPNPAHEVLKQAKIDVRQADWAELVSSDETDALEKAMRQRLGPGSEMFTQDDIYTALCNPGEPAVAISGQAAQMIEAIGEGTILRYMRQLLSEPISEGTTDEDLQTAMQNPGAPLIASGLCRPQVIHLQNLPAEQALHFTPEVLGRKMDVNFYHPWNLAPARPVAAPEAIDVAAEAEVEAPAGVPVSAVPAG